MKLKLYQRNIISAYVGQVLILILQFLLRSVFISCLGNIYVGLNGLFSNILTLLSLSELGIGQAITFSLYEPTIKNATDDIISILRFYKRVYTAIGLFILIVGCALTPFLNVFINELPNIDNIYLIYILFVLSTSISYFFSYKSSYFIARQNNYVVTNNRYIWRLICLICQGISLILFENYILYLLINIVCILSENICIAVLFNKRFPDLKINDKYQLKPIILRDIKTNTKALLFHKIGGTIVFHTDNLLLSKMISLSYVGLYSNYNLIILNLDNILTKIYEALTSTIGRVRITESIEKQMNIYQEMCFITFCVYGGASILLCTLVQPFIVLWIGKKQLLSEFVLIILVFNFYITGMRKSTMMFNDAYGLHKYYKWMPIGEGITNLVLSILFVKYIGAAGIFLGTTVSSICFPVITEPIILYKKGLQKGVKEIRKYFIRYAKYFLCEITCIWVGGWISKLLVIENTLVYMVCIGLLDLILFLAIVSCFFYKTKEYKFILKRILLLITGSNRG